MGHFTHNCKLSGVPIKDNAVLIVMKPNPSFKYIDNELKKYGKSSMISNDGPRMKFLPVWFPIRGKYDDYGRLENIVEDDNTKIISEYYELDIKSIVDTITSGRKDDGFDGSLDIIKKPKVLPNGMKKGETHFDFYQRIMKDPMPNGGRYPQSPNNDYRVYRDGKYVSVSKEVYDADFKEIHDHYARYNKWKETNPDTTDDYGNPQYEERYKDLLSYSAMWVHGDVYQRLTDIENTDDYDKLDLGTPELLEYLGFKEIGRDTNNDRYNRVFEKDGLKVNSDGNWINLANESIYTLKQFKKYCNKMGVDIHIDELDKLGKIGQTYKLLLNSYNPDTNRYGRIRSESDMEYFFLGGPYSNYGDINPFTPLYIQAAKEGKLEDNLVRFWKFDKYLFSMGGYYEVVGTAPQDGEFKDVRTVLQIALNVVDEYIHEYYDEDGEDEDYEW
jgi:hypothetical protein